jgi:hypothetical protein
VNQGRVNIPRLLARGFMQNKENKSFINKTVPCDLNIREKFNKPMSPYRFSRPYLTTSCDIPQVHFHTFPTARRYYYLQPFEIAEIGISQIAKIDRTEAIKVKHEFLK